MRRYKQVWQSSIYRSKEKREKKEEQRRKKAQIAKYKKDKAREQMQEAIDWIKQTKHSLERIEERMSVSEHRVRKSYCLDEMTKWKKQTSDRSEQR